MGHEKGFTLIEVLLAVALVGVLGVTVPSALSGANRATIISNQLTMAESLARNQMDYIQHQPYDSDNITPYYPQLPDIPEPYNIEMTATRLDPKGDGLVHDNGTPDDDGLQEITVLVRQGTKAIFTLIDFKVRIQ